MQHINGNTKLLGIIGNPVSHSLSPLMHNTAFKELDINYSYAPLLVDHGSLAEAIKGLWSLGFYGVNITIPFKEEVFDHVIDLSHEARLIGAINTLVRTENGFRGENTDGQGFIMALKEEKGWEPVNKRIAILGAGGSARAVAISLALAGAEEIIIINRSLAKAKDIADTIYEVSGILSTSYSWETQFLDEVISNCHMVVNTTSLGMSPNIEQIPPIKEEWLTQEQLIVDLIYNPAETKFLQMAKQKGCEVYNGLGMLIYQGALAFNLWTGKEMPIKKIRETLNDYFQI